MGFPTSPPQNDQVGAGPATPSAREEWRARIRQDSARLGAHLAKSVDGQAFYDDRGTPSTDAG